MEPVVTCANSGAVASNKAHTTSAKPNTLQRRTNIQASWIFSCQGGRQRTVLRCATLVQSDLRDKLDGVKNLRVGRDSENRRRSPENRMDGVPRSSSGTRRSTETSAVS